jgi:hypothetical protein
MIAAFDCKSLNTKGRTVFNLHFHNCHAHLLWIKKKNGLKECFEVTDS